MMDERSGWSTEDEMIVFHMDIACVALHSAGSYFLKLTIQGRQQEDYTQLQIECGDNGEVLSANQVRTQLFTQQHPNQHAYLDNSFYFTFPAEFFNGKRKNSHMLVELYKVDGGREKISGEARIDLNEDRRWEDMLTLLYRPKSVHIPVYCGRVRYRASLGPPSSHESEPSVSETLVTGSARSLSSPLSTWDDVLLSVSPTQQEARIIEHVRDKQKQDAKSALSGVSSSRRDRKLLPSASPSIVNENWAARSLTPVNEEDALELAPPAGKELSRTPPASQKIHKPMTSGRGSAASAAHTSKSTKPAVSGMPTHLQTAMQKTDSFYVPTHIPSIPPTMSERKVSSFRPSKLTETSMRPLQTQPSYQPMEHVDVVRRSAEQRRLWQRGIHGGVAGMEVVVVLVHTARDLPLLSDASIPTPFCIVQLKSGTGAFQSIDGRVVGITRASLNPTQCPYWEQVIQLDISTEDITHTEMEFEVSDDESKEVLAIYKFPVSYIQPFHHYHLDMCQAVGCHCCRLYVSIIRRSSSLPYCVTSAKFTALQVVLSGINEELSGMLGPLTVVAKVVSDLQLYRVKLLAQKGEFTGVTMATVSFPTPHPTSFAAGINAKTSAAQITLPGYPSKQPCWDHMFVFSTPRDKATAFTPGGALVLEFYQTSASMSDGVWRLQWPVGISTLLLDHHVYRQLVSPGGRMGLQLPALLVEGKQIVTIDSKQATVGLVLKLLHSQGDGAICASDKSQLPYLDCEPSSSSSRVVEIPMHRTPSDTFPLPGLKSLSPSIGLQEEALNNFVSSSRFDQPEKRRSPEDFSWIMSRNNHKPIQDDDLPPHDAMESILPEYHYIFVDPDQKKSPPSSDTPSRPKATKEDIDKTAMNLLDYQMRELEKYRIAVHTMGEDILSLRRQIQELEATNSQLRVELAHYNDATRLLLDSQELDGLTKPELSTRYVSLKQKLNNQTMELKHYKDKVVELQNDLIKKNDKEKRYLEMSDAHTAQQEIVQKLQERQLKVRKLEEACRKQEKVIEKMEKLLNQQIKNKDSSQRAANEALMEENKRLRGELNESKDQHRALSQLEDSRDKERLDMYHKLERADSRIVSLEKQLADNARQWAQEKADLQMTLRETSHGLDKPDSPLYRTYPKITHKSQSEIRGEPRRYSKAPVGTTKKYKSHNCNTKLDPLRY